MRFLAISLLLAASIALAPSASAAPCDGQYRVEADCWVDYVQPRVNRVVDEAEGASGQDLGLAQAFLNTVVDKVQGHAQDLLDRIPCINTSGPQCW